MKTRFCHGTAACKVSLKLKKMSMLKPTKVQPKLTKESKEVKKEEWKGAEFWFVPFSFLFSFSAFDV